jgi:hypothetical protein
MQSHIQGIGFIENAEKNAEKDEGIHQHITSLFNRSLPSGQKLFYSQNVYSNGSFDKYPEGTEKPPEE